MTLKSEVEKLPGYNSLVRPWHYVKALVAGVRNGFPGKKMRVIGVTGTNGKTSTCFFIWKMLSEAGYKTGVMTTVGWGVEKITPQIEHMTTEDVGVLNERMRKIQEAGAEFLVLEVTSHALIQARTLGVPIEIAVFTNITPEHLDYHKTFTKYRAAKQKLFKKARYGVVNADDPNAEYFTKNYSSGDITTYGIERGDLRATDVKLLAGGVKYACGDIKIETQIPGKFNVYNSLAAVAVGERLGLGRAEIERGIHALDDVEGRMTDIKEGQDFTVIVDYAHQPDAVEKVFEALGVVEAKMKQETGESARMAGRVIAVHGGAGRRDHSTREPRGEILGKYSDIVIITEDDSRDEDPAEIAEMFVKGAEKAGKVRDKDLFVELDRETAIRKAIERAKAGDLVLILGKGHEKTILRKDGPHEFEDIKVVRKILREGWNK